MNSRTRETAERFGILDRMERLEKELLKIPGIAYEDRNSGIDFDLDGWYSDIHQVILIPKYDIPVTDPEYYAKRTRMLTRVFLVCQVNGLVPSGDTVEDYGEHYYIVRNCKKDWYEKKGEKE